MTPATSLPPAGARRQGFWSRQDRIPNAATGVTPHAVVRSRRETRAPLTRQKRNKHHTAVRLSPCRGLTFRLVPPLHHIAACPDARLGREMLNSRLPSSRVGRMAMSVLGKFAKDELGATAIEYGLIAAGISVAIIAIVHGLGTKLDVIFTKVSNALK